MLTRKMLTTSITMLTALIALSGVTACGSTDTSDNLVGVDSAPTAAAPTMTVTSRDTAPGGSTSDAKPSGKDADKATQVHMSIVNNTKQTLHITTATSSGSGNHWQDRPTDLAPGQQQFVSNYAAGDAEINLTYTGDNGATYTLSGETPLVGSNSVSGATDNPSYWVDAQSASGYNPTFNYYINAGHTFSYTGSTQTYTVPAGVTSMQVTAVGGSTESAVAFGTPSSGAQITGSLAVTPGEILTIGVGGDGGNDYNNTAGGWGMASGDSSFRGGNGTPGNEITGGGGGATVIQNSAGQLLVVAGGAGGSGAGGGGLTGYNGGEGGADGSLTGGNGQPGVNAGGKPGANTVSQGQDAPQGGDGAGGAGGGGLNGGLAGIAGTAGGGGAGSSSDAGLTNASVGSAPHPGGNITPAEVVLTAN